MDFKRHFFLYLSHNSVDVLVLVKQANDKFIKYYSWNIQLENSFLKKEIRITTLSIRSN